MLNINRKTCYITQRISIRLREVEKYSINKTWDWAKLYAILYLLRKPVYIRWQIINFYIYNFVIIYLLLINNGKKNDRY